MGKKKDKSKKIKKTIVYRTKEERQNEVKEIISKLSNFNLNTNYNPIKKLYVKFKKYINEGQACGN